MEKLERTLARDWRLNIKASSRTHMATRIVEDLQSEKWEKVDASEVLGHLIMSTAGIRRCYDRTRTKMWAAYFKHVAHFQIAHLEPPLAESVTPEPFCVTSTQFPFLQVAPLPDYG